MIFIVVVWASCDLADKAWYVQHILLHVMPVVKFNTEHFAGGGYIWHENVYIIHKIMKGSGLLAAYIGSWLLKSADG